MGKAMAVMMAALVCFWLLTAGTGTVSADAFDCIDGCYTGCVHGDTRLRQRCEGKCRIRCGPDAKVEEVTN